MLVRPGGAVSAESVAVSARNLNAMIKILVCRWLRLHPSLWTGELTASGRSLFTWREIDVEANPSCLLSQYNFGG